MFFCGTTVKLENMKNVHAGIRAAALVEAAVELPFPVQNGLKVLALHTRYQTVATA